jgi:hypothetical protein
MAHILRHLRILIFSTFISFRDFLESKGPIMVASKEEKKLSATQVAQKALAIGKTPLPTNI